MLKGDKLKGIIFALLAALGYSSVYVLAKYAQMYVKTEVFLPWWFFMASIYSLSIISYRGELGEFITSVKKHRLFFIYFGLSESISTFTFFYLLRIMNPSVISFVSNLSPVFVALWGFIILREKLTPMEILGGSVAIAGVLIISNASPRGELPKILIIVAMVATFSLNTILVRIKVRDIPPIFIVSLRTYALFTAYAIYHIVVNRGIVLPDIRAIPYIVTGSFIGPVAATFAVFQALKHMKAADVSIIKSVQPLMVAVASYIFLNQPPTTSQLIGGVLIIIGVNMVILSNREVIGDRVPEDPCE